MYKSITLIGMMGLMCACLPDIGAGKDSSIIEEPSSEPAEEPSDSTDGDSGSSDGSDGSTVIQMILRRVSHQMNRVMTIRTMELAI